MTNREDQREAFNNRVLRPIDRPTRPFNMRSAVMLTTATATVVAILASVLLFLIIERPG